MPQTRTAIPNRREARVIVTSEDLLSVYMQYCCQRNSFCTVNHSAIVLNCLGRFLALSSGPDRGCGETSGGKGGKGARRISRQTRKLHPLFPARLKGEARLPTRRMMLPEEVDVMRIPGE